MKVTGIKAIKFPKVSLVKRIKRFYTNGSIRLKSLVKDVFEKKESKYIIYDGKKIKRRDLPSYIGVASDYDGVIARHINLYAEDLKLMEKMSLVERRAYRSKLIKENKFYYDK